MAEGFRADAPQARISLTNGGDPVLSLWLDARQLELFCKDVGQLVEGQIHFHEVMAGFGAALAFALAGLAFADDVAFFAIAGADSLRVVAVAEVGQLDPADRDGDQ